MTNYPYSYIHEGDRSAAPSHHSKNLHCDRCNVGFIGCWDNSDCEWCGRNLLTGKDHPENPLNLSRRSQIENDR